MLESLAPGLKALVYTRLRWRCGGRSPVNGAAAIAELGALVSGVMRPGLYRGERG